MPGAVIIGAGPGLGGAVALRFARERFPIALIARSQPTLDRTGDALVDSGVNVVGALTAAVHVAPRMIDNGGGTILITGGMPTPDPRYVSLSLGKAGVRA